MAMSTRPNKGFTKPRRHHVLGVVIVAATLGVIFLLPYFQDVAHDRPVVTPGASASPYSLTSPIKANTEHPVSSGSGVFSGASSLLLTGVFFSVTEAHKSFAVIRNEQAEERQFRLGERVSGDIYIQHIYPDHVVIAAGNQTEILWLGGSHVIAEAARGSESANHLPGKDTGHAGRNDAVEPRKEVRSPLNSVVIDPMSLLGRNGQAMRFQPDTSSKRPRTDDGRATDLAPSSRGTADQGSPPAWTYDNAAFEEWWHSEEPEDPASDEDQRLDAWLNSDEDFPPE